MREVLPDPVKWDGALPKRRNAEERREREKEKKIVSMLVEEMCFVR